MRVQFDDLEFICPINTIIDVELAHLCIITLLVSYSYHFNESSIKSMQVKLENFEFACAPEHAGVTTHVFPMVQMVDSLTL